MTVAGVIISYFFGVLVSYFRVYLLPGSDQRRLLERLNIQIRRHCPPTLFLGNTVVTLSWQKARVHLNVYLYSVFAKPYIQH